MNRLRPPAETAVRKCMQLQETESCLIVTDHECNAIGEALYMVAKQETDQVSIIKYPPGEQSGEEPPATAATAMREADVVLAPTIKSISHTQARSEAISSNSRVATLPGVTEDVFISGLEADYLEIQRQCEKIYSQVRDSDKMRVETELGTDIVFELNDQEWTQDTGIVHEPGTFSNLPAGEVFISPETGNGTFVIDGTMRPCGLLAEDQELKFEVEDGYVSKISNDLVRRSVENAAEKVGDDAYNLAELGIGTNIGVEELVGSVILDEKAAGTVHIAIGDDHAIGGDTTAPIHVDGIIRNPTVYADGKEIKLPEGV